MGRRLRPDEREVLQHLLRGSEPLSAALRQRVDDVRVVEEGVCCASIRISAGEERLAHLTGGVPLKAESIWRGRRQRAVRLVITESGALSRLEVTHTRGKRGPMAFPHPSKLTHPLWKPVG